MSSIQSSSQSPLLNYTLTRKQQRDLKYAGKKRSVLAKNGNKPDSGKEKSFEKSANEVMKMKTIKFDPATKEAFLMSQRLQRSISEPKQKPHFQLPKWVIFFGGISTTLVLAGLLHFAVFGNFPNTIVDWGGKSNDTSLVFKKDPTTNSSLNKNKFSMEKATKSQILPQTAKSVSTNLFFLHSPKGFPPLAVIGDNSIEAGFFDFRQYIRGKINELSGGFLNSNPLSFFLSRGCTFGASDRGQYQFKSRPDMPLHQRMVETGALKQKKRTGGNCNDPKFSSINTLKRFNGTSSNCDLREFFDSPTIQIQKRIDKFDEIKDELFNLVAISPTNERNEFDYKIAPDVKKAYRLMANKAQFINFYATQIILKIDLIIEMADGCMDLHLDSKNEKVTNFKWQPPFIFREAASMTLNEAYSQIEVKELFIKKLRPEMLELVASSAEVADFCEKKSNDEIFFGVEIFNEKEVGLRPNRPEKEQPGWEFFYTLKGWHSGASYDFSDNRHILAYRKR